MVMNGPMPIMFDMFSAVALARPKSRINSSCDSAALVGR